MSVRKTLIAASVALSACLGCSAVAAEGLWAGAGLGIPYGGVIGAKASYDINLGGATLSPSLGVGSAIAATGVDVGAQVYFGDKTARTQLGVGVWYGTNTVVSIPWADDVTGKGVTLGFTPRTRFGESGRHAVDWYVLYIASANYDKPTCPKYYSSYCSVSVVDVGSKVKIGAGYSFNF